MIDPNNITTIRVGQLADAPLNLTDNIPHEVGTDLKRATIQELVNFVSTAIGAGSGVGFLPISVTDGQQLPDVPADPSFFLAGKGTFLNINGYPDIVCTEELNAIMSLSDHWEIAVEIPISADYPTGVSNYVAKFSGGFLTESQIIDNGARVLIGTTTDNGVDTLQIDGSLIGTEIKKLGGTSSQILAADGSILTAGENITIIGGQISSIGGGGGTNIKYYLNGGTSVDTFDAVNYYEFSQTAVVGTGADFSISSNGYIASFITEVADPSKLLIPAGNWNLEFFFSSSSAGGSPSFYAELYKYDGVDFTLIASSSATPEGITNGTAIDAYFSAIAVPETVLNVSDRLAIRVYVNASSKTITLHTQNSHLCEVITTFVGVGAIPTLQQVTDEGAVTDNDIEANSFIKTGGVSTEFLKANGTVDSNTYQTVLTNPITGTGIIGKLPKFTGSSALGNSRITDNGTYLGIGTANDPTKDITLGNQENREIGIEESSNTVIGKNLTIAAGRTINYVPNSDFNPLNQTVRAWFAMTAANGNVYASVTGDGIYMQTAGTGNFVSLQSFGSDVISSMASDSLGNVYAMIGTSSVYNLYKQTAGVGAFTIVSGITPRNYAAIAITSSGDMYATIAFDDIYYRTGSGDFIALGQGSRWWAGITVAPNNDVYTVVYNGGIYKRTGGVGAFTALSEPNRDLTQIFAASNGNIYASSWENTGLYMQTAGTGAFNVINSTPRNWRAFAEHTSGNIYVSVFNGDIYLQQNNGTGTTNLNGGTLKQVAGTGKGTGDSNIDFYTGAKTTSGTDMQIETLRARINNEGLMTLPSVTNALINANSKSIITKEYGDATYLTSLSGAVLTIINEFPGTTVTGTLSETLLSTFTIPGGTLPTSCMPDIRAKFSKSGDTGTSQIRFRINTVNNFATATQIGTYSAVAATDTFLMSRNPVISAGNMNILIATTSVQSDLSGVSTTESNFTIDVANDIYLFVSTVQSSILDTTTLRAFKIIN
jgi:hypothetical protein